jgi:hypothetical protein
MRGRLLQVAVLVGAFAAAAACAKSDPPEECAALTDIGNSLNYNAWTKKVGNAWPPRHHDVRLLVFIDSSS